MSIVTRAQVETILVARCGPWMKEVSMAETTDGTNADLTDPIRRALLLCGGTLASPVAVTDADLATVDADERLDELLDRAELRIMQTVQRRLRKTSVLVVGAVQTYKSDLLRAINDIVRQLTSDMKQTWGLGGSSGVGVLYWGTAETTEAVDDDDED